MNEKININEGGEGAWNIPKENQTNVLGKVRVEFEEGESPIEHDSEGNEMDEETKERAEGFVGEREYENRLELSREDKQGIGQKVLSEFEML